MIPRIINTLCFIALLAMTAAVGHHWLSSHPDSFSRVLPSKYTPKATATKSQAVAQAVAQATPKPTRPGSTSPSLTNTTAPSNSQQEFYSSLIRQIENLQNQNRDLVDQLAETNRELMKLEFRVDTHSSQFRPLPVTEDRADTSFEENTGLLPPRPSIIEENFSGE